jgi:hypothetical protein
MTLRWRDAVMTETVDIDHGSGPRPPRPHPKLRDLDVLEGTWQLEGHDFDGGSPFTGTVTRRWLPGGHFLVQETRMDGDEHEGAEYVGYDHTQQPRRSMFFSNEGPGPFCSFALEYFWQIEGDDLTIWHGARDSPALHRQDRPRRRHRRRTLGVARWRLPGDGDPHRRAPVIRCVPERAAAGHRPGLAVRAAVDGRRTDRLPRRHRPTGRGGPAAAAPSGH